MKVSGSYESVTRGVSEQVPQDRRPGQHFEQVNMISDPVRGLARRHGSRLQDENVIGTWDDTTYNKMLGDTLRHKSFTFYVDGVEYDLVYRTTADTYSLGQSSFAFAMNKVTGQFIPIVYKTSDATLDSLVSGGVSAAVNVGKYIFLAGNSIVPSWTPAAGFDSPSNQRLMVAWVRGGAFSRTFKITLIKADGTKITVDYKTVSSSYPTLLDTTGILTESPPGTPNPNYQKQINDAVNAYNSEVTKWIGTAAADITPQNIASKLYDKLVLLGVTCTLRDSTVAINDANYVEIQCDDSGDGSLIRGVGNEVPLPDAVSIVHYAGKIVKVKPKKNNADDAFYLKAVPKETGQTGLTEVSWVETAGYTILPLSVFVMGTVVGGSLYLAGTAAGLQAISGDVTPTYKANEVGDDITCPLPYFFGKRIDYLGTFQDRLLIGSGAVMFFSRPGDYLNWFRGSVLTVIDTDPVEMYALGSEDDTIVASTTYDRNLLLFGHRLQYTINGRQPLTPKSASIVILSAHEDAVDAYPENSGNYVFYCKSRNNISSVHQIQIGLLADSPESYNVSQQLDRYIAGKPVELVTLTAPNVVMLRTDGLRNRLYVYTYLDTPAGTERVFDAWDRWEWATSLGSVVGISRYQGDVLVYMLRHGINKDGAHKTWIACERFVLDTGLSKYPYLDSLRTYNTFNAPAADTFINSLSTDLSTASIVFDDTSPLFLLGSKLSARAEFVAAYSADLSHTWVGTNFPAYFSPTNPYVKDKNDKAIVNGRLTLGRVGISVTDTGGLTVDLTTANGTKTVTDFNGRIVGRASDLVGRQPIVTTVVSGAIGKEVRDCGYTVSAKTWLPLTVTSIEWTGQFFQNARRV